ncbi:MAG: tetratricopeptide repeat protein [Anaerolineae bacterium]
MTKDDDAELRSRYQDSRRSLEKGDLQRARQSLEDLLSEDPRAQLRAEVLHALGVARHGLGDVPGAIEALEAGEALQDHVEDAEARGRLLANLGAAYLAAEQPEKAEAAYRGGLVRLEKAGVDARVLAQGWRGLGRAHLALGGLVHERRAVESHGRSLEIFEADGDRSEMAVSLNLMGHASLARYKWSEALGSFRQALALWEGLRDRRGMAVASNGMGRTFYEKEDYEPARKYFEQDLAHSRAAKDTAGVARALIDLGRAYAALRSWKEAGQAYDEALAIRRGMGDRRGEALVHWARAHMAFSREDRDGAVSEMESAVSILRELGNRDLQRAERHLSRMRRERPGPWRRYL